MCASDDDEDDEEADDNVETAGVDAAATTACRDDRTGRAFPPLPPCRGETGVALADDGTVDEAALEEAAAAADAARAAAAAASAACAARSAMA